LNLGDSTHFNKGNFVKGSQVLQGQKGFCAGSTVNLLLSSSWQVCDGVIQDRTAPNEVVDRNKRQRMFVDDRARTAKSIEGWDPHLSPVSSGACQDTEIVDPVVAP